MTITKSGELTSFYTVNKAPIKHLRVYFSPKQAGTGDPSPDNVRTISGWNKVIINSVPNEYQEVEYIESPGSSSSTSSGVYIDTKIIPYLGLCSEMIYKSKGSGYAYGSIYTSNTDYYGWNTTNDSAGRIQPYLGTGRYPSIYNYSMNNFHKLTINNKKFYVDDILIYDYNDSSNIFNFTNATSIYIGALHSSAPIMTPGQFKTTYFWDNLTKNYLGIFVPCYRKSDNTVGMYDIITKKFFQSETNQSFIAGPNVSNIIQMDWFNDIGTIYGGYVDLITGELVQTHNRLILDGSEHGWVSATSNRIAYIEIPEMKSGTWYTDSSALCNYAKKVNTSSNDYFECLIGYNNKKLYFYNAKTVIQDVSDLESFKAWLSTHNIIITYPIDIPIIHQLTSTQLSTFIGRNNIWSNADRVEIEYDLAESNDELYRRRNILLRTPHIETAAGSIATFKTDMQAPLKKCKIYFNPVQQGEGDPSPDNVRSISGWNSLEASRCGKNLFDLWAKGYWTTSTKTWSPSTAGAVSKPIPVRAGDVVTITQDNTSASYQFIEWSKKVEWPNEFATADCLASVQSAQGAPRTYTVQHDCYLCAFVNIGNDSFDSRHVQLEFGNGSTYSAYTSTTYPISWTDQGTVYGGYIDLTNGTLIRTWGSYTVSDNTVFNTSINYPLQWLRINLDNASNVAPAILPHTGYGGELSDKMPYSARRQDNIFGTVVGTYDSGIFYNSIYIFNTNIVCPSATTAQDCVNYIKSIAPTFVYPIKNVETYQLNHQQIKTLIGQNNIWSNANGPVEISYWTH